MKLKYALVGPLVASAAFIGFRFARSHVDVVHVGIHFRVTPVDFGAPPPRYSPTSDEESPMLHQWRASTTESPFYSDADEEAAKQKRKDFAKNIARADQLLFEGKYASAMARYRKLNAAGMGYSGYLIRRAQLAHDLLGSKTNQKVKWVAAATAFDSKAPLPSLASVPMKLRPYVAYEKASRLFESNKFPQAAESYSACAHQYSTSWLAEPATIMSARILILPATKPQRPAAKEVSAFLAKYPHSRFKASALGLVGRGAFLEDRYSDAATYYNRELSLPISHDVKQKTLDSLLECYTALNRPDLAAATWLKLFASALTINDAYYDTNNLSGLLSKMDKRSNARFASYLRVNPDWLAYYIQLRLELTVTSKTERREISRIAEESLKRSKAFSPSLSARLAQVCYWDGDSAKSAAFAAKAAASARQGTEAWAIAHYLLGTMARNAGRYSKAKAEYARVAALGPKNYLAVGSHEAIAFMEDSRGRLSDALDQLLWLREWSAKYQNGFDFQWDIAYMLDAKMSPDQIETYISNHPNCGHIPLLKYTLGIRYMRLGMFSRAHTWLAMVPAKVRASLSHTGVDDDPFEPGPVQDPLTTCEALSHITNQVVAEPSSEGKAAKLYELASYYYEKRGLLLYNAPLWQGGRADAFGYSWDAHTAGKADNAALERHHLDCECLQHAVDLCREILEKYPATKSAPRAAYRAACAEERLSNFNNYWRWASDKKDLLGRAADFMGLVAKRYPTSPLAADAAKYEKVYRDERKQGLAEEMWNRKYSVYTTWEPGWQE